jgi:lipoic acid synthetase
MTKPAFPEWIRQKWPSGKDFSFTKDLVEGLGLHTVCQSARCPNLAECWKERTATLMLLGHLCTRSCRYCSVPGAKRPEPVDEKEPVRVAEAVHHMGLRHAVITSVTRDDLSDGGASHFAATIRAIRERNPDTTIEVLTPDFQGNRDSIMTVLEAGPAVFSHNIETVERLYPVLRSRQCGYDTAVGVLRVAAESALGVIVKSALMVGHGETEDEVRMTLEDLLAAGCEAVSIGQYLRPTRKQKEVVEYVSPGQFRVYEEMAYSMGFSFAVAGPFVRSSYRSGEMMREPFARRRARSAAGCGGDDASG